MLNIIYDNNIDDNSNDQSTNQFSTILQFDERWMNEWMNVSQNPIWERERECTNNQTQTSKMTWW